MSSENPASVVSTVLAEFFNRLLIERTTNFSGREWVFEAVDTWLENPAASRFFLLTGGPGTGKSAIAARIAQMNIGAVPTVSDLNSIRPEFLSYYHFCQASLLTTLSPLDFAQGMAESLAGRYPEFRQALERKGSPQFNVAVNVGSVQAGGVVVGSKVTIQILSGDAIGLFDALVRRPLRELCTAKPNEKIVILVDSLDEAVTFDAGNNIARLLGGCTDLPAQVKFLVTSRSNVEAVTRIFGNATLDLIANAPPGLDEVRIYAAARLAHLAKPARGKVAQLVAGQSHGNFLYAYHVLNQLAGDNLSAADISAINLPVGLEGVYEKYIGRVLATNPSLWNNVFRPVLGLIVVALGDGLTRAQIIGITGLAEDSADDVLTQCAEFLVGGGDAPFRVFHQSFREFLLKEKPYGVYPAERHAAIARWLDDRNGANWEKCVDQYALRFTPQHWAESAQLSVEDTRAKRTQALIELVLNARFQRAFERRVGNLLALRDHVFRAVKVVALSESDDMLPWVLRASLGLLEFNRDYLQAEAVLKLAEEGKLDEAESRLGLFTDIGENWQRAAKLVLCWLAFGRNPDAARKAFELIIAQVEPDRVLKDLRQRVSYTLDNKLPVPGPSAPASGTLIGREILKRISGQQFDPVMLTSGINGSLMTAKQFDPEMQVGESQYASVTDGPVLVSIALNPGPDGAEGTQLVDQYVQAHAGYNYVVYRNESLWFVLEAVQRMMPDQDWVRDRLRGILIAALTGGAVEYREMLPMTAKLLRDSLASAGGHTELSELSMFAWNTASSLQAQRGANDIWGNHKRRLTALMELAALMFKDTDAAAQLRQRIRQLPSGFAGFQAPAFLRFSDALNACGDVTPADRQWALDEARVSSHHIQDYHFSARVNSRCNALRDWHSRAMDAEAMANAIGRLVEKPDDGEFASDHFVGDAFEHREGGNQQWSTIAPARKANTLGALAEVFQRPVAEFMRLNPGYVANQPIPPSTHIRVPDPGLAPLLAIHFAARVLAEPALDGRRPALIRALIPSAVVNATTLDSLLSYLVVASQVVDEQLADELVGEAGPVTFGNVPVPFGLIGPDSVMPA